MFSSQVAVKETDEKMVTEIFSQTSSITSEERIKLPCRTVSSSPSLLDLHDKEKYFHLNPQANGSLDIDLVFELETQPVEASQSQPMSIPQYHNLSFENAIVTMYAEEKARIDTTSYAYIKSRDALGESHWSYIAEASGKFIVGKNNILIELNEDGSIPSHFKCSAEDQNRARKRYLRLNPRASCHFESIPQDDYSGWKSANAQLLAGKICYTSETQSDILEKIQADASNFTTVLNVYAGHPDRENIFLQPVSYGKTIFQIGVTALTEYDNESNNAKWENIVPAELERLDRIAGEDEFYYIHLRAALKESLHRASQYFSKPLLYPEGNAFVVVSACTELFKLPHFKDVCGDDYKKKAIAFLRNNGGRTANMMAEEIEDTIISFEKEDKRTSEVSFGSPVVT